MTQEEVAEYKRIRPQPAPAQDPNHGFIGPDPFPEPVNAFRGNGAMPADAFNQEFMRPDELAQFLITPGSQNQPLAMHAAPVGSKKQSSAHISVGLDNEEGEVVFPGSKPADSTLESIIQQEIPQSDAKPRNEPGYLEDFGGEEFTGTTFDDYRMSSKYHQYMSVPREGPYEPGPSTSRSKQRSYEEQRLGYDQQATPQPNAALTYTPLNPPLYSMDQAPSVYRYGENLYYEEILSHSYSRPWFPYNRDRGRSRVYGDEYRNSFL